MSEITNPLRPSRPWTVVTLLLGVASAPLISWGTPGAERTFATVNAPVQLFMSLTAPFVAVLLVGVVRDRGGRSVAAVARWAATCGLCFAVVGGAASAISVAGAGSGAAGHGGPWRHAVGAALGSLLVQVVCQGLGLGFGAVVLRPWPACLATFSPLPVWGLLALAGAAPLAAWLTPGANAQALLEGDRPVAWVREVTVVLAWGLLFWTAGARRLLFGHDHATHP